MKLVNLLGFIIQGVMLTLFIIFYRQIRGVAKVDGFYSRASNQLLLGIVFMFAIILCTLLGLI
jgi:hypothetical protein